VHGHSSKLAAFDVAPFHNLPLAGGTLLSALARRNTSISHSGAGLYMRHSDIAHPLQAHTQRA
jgi:hypothetical protein